MLERISNPFMGICLALFLCLNAAQLAVNAQRHPVNPDDRFASAEAAGESSDPFRLLDEDEHEEDEDNMEDECEDDVRGLASDIDTGAGTLVVGNVLVVTTDTTRFQFRGDFDLTLADINEGETVLAIGCFQSDGSLLAKKVMIKQSGGGPDGLPGGFANVHVLGNLSDIDPENETLTVGMTTFLVTERTTIQQRNDRDLSLEDLSVGMRVRVKGKRDGDLFVAERIKVQEENVTPGGNGASKLLGLVTAVDLPTSLTVRDQTVLLTKPPEVVAFDDTPSSITQIAVGDFLQVVGKMQDDGTLLALGINIRASVITDINAAEMTFVASNTTIYTTPTTEFKGPGLVDISFDDLAIGDLAKIEGEPFMDGVLARDVKVLDVTTFSDTIPGFTPADSLFRDGDPVLISRDNNTFGWVQLPSQAFSSPGDVLYELTATVSSDVPDVERIPVVRLRNNMATFEKGAEYAITSTTPDAVSPTVDGREYKTYFVPTVGPDNDVDNWFLSMDLLNIDPNDAPNASIRLHEIDFRVIPISDLEVEEVLYAENFANSNHGWTASAPAEGFTPPDAQWNSETTSLDLSARNHRTVGFWTYDTGIPAEAGTLYRARFLISSQTEDPHQVPTIRTRIQPGNFVIGAVTTIESTGQAYESPGPDGRTYDAYLRIPEGFQEGSTLLLSFDMLNTQLDNATNDAVSLEHVILEELSIPE